MELKVRLRRETLHSDHLLAAIGLGILVVRINLIDPKSSTAIITLIYQLVAQPQKGIVLCLLNQNVLTSLWKELMKRPQDWILEHPHLHFPLSQHSLNLHQFLQSHPYLQLNRPHHLLVLNLQFLLLKHAPHSLHAWHLPLLLINLDHLLSNLHLHVVRPNLPPCQLHRPQKPLSPLSPLSVHSALIRQTSRWKLMVHGFRRAHHSQKPLSPLSPLCAHSALIR